MVSSEPLAKQLSKLISPDSRNKMLAKGLARGVIWTDGNLPLGAPAYGNNLTGNLLDYGFSILTKALTLFETAEDREIAIDSLRFAAECIESASRRGKRDDFRGFHLIVAAAAFHLAGYAARSYCLLKEEIDLLNLSTVEKFLVSLLKKELKTLRLNCFTWLADEKNQDEGYSKKIESYEGDQEPELINILIVALNRNYVKAVAEFEQALSVGDSQSFKSAQEHIKIGLEISTSVNHIPQWWCHKLTKILFDEIWANSLHVVLPQSSSPEEQFWTTLRKKYISVQNTRNVSEILLWPSQINAAGRIWDTTDDLVVALPTSAGKTKIAELCILRALSQNKRAFYITPLRALSAQMEKRLARTFNPLGFSVTSVYGSSGATFQDVDRLSKESIVVATPEKLDFALRQDPSVLDDVGVVVLDEGHMIGLGTREIRYEVLVQKLLRRSDIGDRRIVCLSAIFASDQSFCDFTSWLRSDAEGNAVTSDWRPTRQRLATVTWASQHPMNDGRLTFFKDKDFEEAFIPGYVKNTIPNKQSRRRKSSPADPQELTLQTASRLVQDGHSVLIYCPQKRSVEPLGIVANTLFKQSLFPSLLEKLEPIKLALAIGEEWLGTDHVALQCLRLGIGIHHGSLPRAFLSEVENLLDNKILPIVIASPTMAQGVDLTCSALIFHSIYQYKDELIKSSDYANVVGRAGRAYVDLDGLIVFPVFQPTVGKQKQIRNLTSKLSVRKMESGLLQLIDKLINLIKEKFQIADENFSEYILNQQFAWDITKFDNDTDESESYLIDSLDSAIMDTVEDLDVDVAALPAILDAALHSSLWQRRLKTVGEDKSVQQKNIIRGRAAWLWHHTSALQRKGFFAAGLGFAAGSVIAENIEVLSASLESADRALEEKKVDIFVENTKKIADILFTTYPYSRNKRDVRWPELLCAWLSGASITVPDNTSHALSCIQEDFVYRLVWGVEAVRAYMRETGDQREDSLSGIIPRAITYGVPSRSASLLLEQGLPSRRLAQEILVLFPANLKNAKDMIAWLKTITTDPFSENDSDSLIWRTFLNNLSKQNYSSLGEENWKIESTTENVVFVPQDQQTILCNSDLSEITRLDVDFRNRAVYEIEKVDPKHLLVKTVRVV